MRLDINTLGLVIYVVVNSTAAISFDRFLKQYRMVCVDFWFSGLIDNIRGCKIEKEEEEKCDVKETNDLLGLGS